MPLFNVNYFDTEESYKVGNTTIEANASNLAIKESVTGVYFLCRILALAIGGLNGLPNVACKPPYVRAFAARV